MTIFPEKNKTTPAPAQSNGGSDGNIADVTIQSDVTIRLSYLRGLCQDAKDARADLDNDFPVGAAARRKWIDARSAMADACPELLDHIDGLRAAIEGFMARRADLRPLLYDEFSRAQVALDGHSDANSSVGSSK